ncbi:hypothetical protein C7M84_019362 [Penaeus vannamei]|uniref:Uncharacterized protein n=1 Tax=Penaeus vannamei TaxID=6689 RepID=A0A3R7LRY3_PENVA|nr:hypothetical protein C7M84_019362 [Penaeus vannamei]
MQNFKTIFPSAKAVSVSWIPVAERHVRSPASTYLSRTPLPSAGGAVACGCPGTNQVYVLHKAPMTGWYTFVPGEEGFQLVVNLEDEAKVEYKLVYVRTRQAWVIKEIRSPMVNDLFTWNSTGAQGDGVNNVKIFCPGPCRCRKVKVRGERCFRGYYGRTDVVEQLKEEETARLEQEALAKALRTTKGLSLLAPSPRLLPTTSMTGEDALETLFRQMNGKDNRNLPKVKIQSPSTSPRKSLSRVKRFSLPGQRDRNQRANIDNLQGLLAGQFNLGHDGAGLQNGRKKGWQDERRIDQVDNTLDEQDGDRHMFDILLNDQQDDQLNRDQKDLPNGRQVELPNDRQYPMLSNWQGSRQEDQRDARPNERKAAAQNEQEDDALTRLLFAQSQVRQRDSYPLLSSRLPKKPAPKNTLQETLDMLNKLSECVLSPPETSSSATERPSKSCAAGTHPVSAKVKPKPPPYGPDTRRTRRNLNLTILQSFNNLHIDGQDSEVVEEETVKCEPDVYAYMGNAEYKITRTETGHFWWIGMGNDLFAVSDEGGPCLDQLPAHTKWMTAVDRNAVKNNENVTVQCVDWDPS